MRAYCAAEAYDTLCQTPELGSVNLSETEEHPNADISS